MTQARFNYLRAEKVGSKGPLPTVGKTIFAVLLFEKTMVLGQKLKLLLSLFYHYFFGLVSPWTPLLLDMELL